MTNVRITIDGDDVFDGNLEEWQATPPDVFKDMLRPDASPEPWLKAIMIAMTDAVMIGYDVNIEAVTGANEWAVGVKKT